MLRASWRYYPLIFRQAAGTSRGVLHRKDAWFIRLDDSGGRKGTGELSFIPGLSVEDGAALPGRLEEICRGISRGEIHAGGDFPGMPGLKFALECALLDLEGGGCRRLFRNSFSAGKTGIPTNGLIWMGKPAFMREQITAKLEAGFRVLKLKVGALGIEQELALLKEVRKSFSPETLEIRLDANGAWTEAEAPRCMQAFAAFHIHSIEQPLAAGQTEAMGRICREEILPVALDEELIGIETEADMQALLCAIDPAYLILKPGLLGGFRRAEKWIRLAGARGTGWWVTSALESAIGLNDIAQWTAGLDTHMHQGLGTGQIYTNNLPSPLFLDGERLWHDPERGWDLSVLDDE